MWIDTEDQTVMLEVGSKPNEQRLAGDEGIMGWI
jgi:hypothetical protein